VSEERAVLCGDSKTWRHKGEKIHLSRLLQLIEENRGPEGLDLHACNMEGIDARPEMLGPHIETHARKHGPDTTPPWLANEGGINLRAVHLENATLQAAQLKNAELRDAHLENARLSRADLENASLYRAHLQSCYLRHANLKCAFLVRADLGHAHLHRANLDYARLKHARLDAATLGGAQLTCARLDNAQMRGAKLHEAHLEGARLEFAQAEGANLEHANLQHAALRGAHLENASLWLSRLDGASWYGSHLNRTGLRRQQLGSAIGDELAARGQTGNPGTFLRAREAYQTLKTNFDSIGRYDDASWAYVKEQQMEKAMHFPATQGHKWIRDRIGNAVPPPWWGLPHLPRWLWWKLRSAFWHTSLFLSLCPRNISEAVARRDEHGGERNEWLSRWHWARNWAFELLTGYGEHWWKPLLWALAVIVCFSLGYWGAGNVAADDGGGTHDFVTALTHSVGAFATIGFNTLEPQGWGARLLTAIEAMFGIGLFALFVFTLGNRMRRS